MQLSPSVLFLAIRSGAIDDPEERFIQVVKYYLAGWHIKPKGVKKPFVSHTSPPLHFPPLPSLSP